MGAVSSERLPLLRYVCLLGVPPADLAKQDGWKPALFQEMVAGGAAESSETVCEHFKTRAQAVDTHSLL